MTEIVLISAAGLSLTGKATMELRGETKDGPVNVVIPAQAAAYLIAGLATLAADYSRIEHSEQDLAVLHVDEAEIQSLVTRDGAYLVLRARGGFQSTYSVSLDQLENLGTVALRASKRMREAGPPGRH